MSGVTARDEWIVRYENSHQHPVNRACHTVGIPMIVLALLLGAVSIFVPRLRVAALVMFALGWVLQFIGHAFEGKAPFSAQTLKEIEQFKSIYGMTLKASDSHKLTERKR